LLDVGTVLVLSGARSFFQISADELAEFARAARYRQREFAARLNLTSRTIERYFHVRFSCTPSEWLAALRMEHAVELLSSGGSIKEVASLVAFRHETSFFREFRRRFGCTPQQYVRGKNSVQLNGNGLASRLVVSQSASVLSQSASARRLRLAPAA
jgi:AraC-like DNA-binding protein